MKHKKNLRHSTIPAVVSDFENMRKEGVINYLEPTQFEEIVEYYEEVQNLSLAMETLELAIERFPFQANFLLSQASVFLGLNNPEDALAAIDKAAALSPGHWEVQFRKAEYLAAKKAYAEADILLDELINERPEADLGMVFLLKGIMYQDQTQFEKMFTALKNSIKHDPANEHTLHLFWLSVEICQKHEESIRIHKWVIDQSPYSALAWSNLGHAYSCLQQWKNATEAFEYAYIIDENFEFAYRDAAIAWMNLKQHDKAFEVLQEGLQFFDPDAEVLEHMGICQMELNEFEQARVHLLDALSLDATSSQVHYLLGKLHFKFHNYKKSLVYLKRAQQLDEANIDCIMELGRVCVEIADIPQANLYFKDACDLEDSNLNIHLEYISFLQKYIGDIQALQFLKSTQDKFPSATIEYYLIGLLFQMNQRELGLVQLAKTLDSDYRDHTTLLKNFPKLAEDPDISALIQTFKPVQ